MLTQDNAREAVGAQLLDIDGKTIGTISRVYLANSTTEPRFALVDTSADAARFVPLLHPATSVGADGAVTVPWSRETVVAAPHVADTGHLPATEEQRLLDYYRSAASDRDGDLFMVRSEEQLTVATRREPVGRARVRRFVTTETQTLTVQVRREYAALEVAPFDDRGYTTVVDRHDDPHGDNVVLINEEFAEVVTTMRPVARAWIGIETRTTDQVVTETVRRENIAVEGDLVEPRR